MLLAARGHTAPIRSLHLLYYYSIRTYVHIGGLHQESGEINLIAKMLTPVLDEGHNLRIGNVFN